MTRKGFFTSSLVDFDHNRKEYPLRSAMDMRNPSTRWRCVLHTFSFLIGKEHLAFTNGIAFANGHGGFHARVVTAQNRDVSNRTALFDHLLRLAGDGEIEPFFDFNHAFPMVPTPHHAADYERKCQWPHLCARPFFAFHDGTECSNVSDRDNAAAKSGPIPWPLEAT